jgi:hypothetical protein
MPPGNYTRYSSMKKIKKKRKGKEQYRRKGGKKERGEEKGHSSFSCKKKGGL